MYDYCTYTVQYVWCVHASYSYMLANGAWKSVGAQSQLFSNVWGSWPPGSDSLVAVNGPIECDGDDK